MKKPKLKMETGQQVMLNSGGAVMTVRFIVGETAALNTGLEIGVHCDWHDGAGIAHRGCFKEAQLTFANHELR